MDLPGPLILYGRSMGGAAALRAVADLGVGPDAVIVESVFGQLLTAVRNRFALMGVPSFPGAELLVFWGGVQIGSSGFGHNPEEYARGCSCPTLVLHGANDRHATPEEATAIYENLGGAGELKIFSKAGHTSLCLAEPDHWREVVASFLAENAQRSCHGRK
jgi:alpha-beta hydrolase superfamily lysophospholipase